MKTKINKAISIAKKIKREHKKITIGELLKALYENDVLDTEDYEYRKDCIHENVDYYKKNTAAVDIDFYLGSKYNYKRERISIQYYLNPELDWNLDNEIRIEKIEKEFYL